METQPTKEGELEPKLYGRTIAEWHDHLTGDNLAVPASRYGRDASECAWWALASMYIFERYYPGEIDDPEAHADNGMSMAVNDHNSLWHFVMGHLEMVPQEVQDNLNLESGIATSAWIDDEDDLLPPDGGDFTGGNRG